MLFCSKPFGTKPSADRARRECAFRPKAPARMAFTAPGRRIILVISRRRDAHALFLSRTVRRRRQQRLWAEGVRVPAARRRAVRHEHIFDASAAPRGQLPYIVDDGETIGDSETIIAHVIAKYRLSIDAALSPRAARQQPPDHPHARRSLLGDVLFALEGRALLAGVPRRADARASERHRRRASSRRASSISSVIISRASAATRRRPPMRAGLPI